jgi:hypothetical protein
MLLRVGAHDFDVQVLRTSNYGHTLPFTTCRFDGIARVCNNADTEPQIVSGQAVGQLVTFPLNVDRAQLPQRLFDSVNSHVSGADAGSEQL